MLGVAAFNRRNRSQLTQVRAELIQYQPIPSKEFQRTSQPVTIPGKRDHNSDDNSMTVMTMATMILMMIIIIIIIIIIVMVKGYREEVGFEEGLLISYSFESGVLSVRHSCGGIHSRPKHCVNLICQGTKRSRRLETVGIPE